MESEMINSLKNENAELKRTLDFLLNKSLVSRLTKAINRINSGDYISEEEFFKDSH